MCYLIFQDGIRILEALSASGLRGIRYAKEIAGVKEVVANDLSESAVTTIRKNIVRNGIEHLMSATHSDAA
jgi:tRNA (guanine26-N2/guanine27-N2)-dimethyltransferase